nr:RNA-dependent RNA polymerase [Marmot picobirnavirus]
MKDLRNISDWDLSKSEKFRPQGGSAPLRLRLEGLNEYFEHLDSPVGIQSQMWQTAKQIAVKRLRFNESGQPTTLKAVIDRGLGEDKYNTNSGYSLYLKRKSKEAITNTLTVGWNAFSDKYPFTLGTRATMGKTGIDARNIFMAPMAINVCGQSYQQPLQDYLRSLCLDFFLPWEGWDSVQANISKCWDSGLKFGADYTKMDQHFNIHHAREVFDVVKHYFRRQYWDQLLVAIEYPFTAPILTNLGYIDQEHALASGSEWTNFLETVWNYVFVVYLELKYHLSFVTAMGIGDDQLWILEGKWTDKMQKWIIQTVIKEFALFGLPGNSEKQEVSMVKTGFLQRHMVDEWNGPNGDVRAAGVYSLIRNATSEVYPERYHNEKDWDTQMFALRCIMIAENCNMHPEFKWYVQEWLAKANKNIIEFVLQADSVIRETQKRARNIANFLPTYNQEKQDQDILTFDVVKLLREVA